jgi:hypothetical protein
MVPGFEDQFVWSRLVPRLPLNEPNAWPPEITGDLFRDRRILALSRSRFLFEIGTLLSGGSPDELRCTHYQR